MNRKLFDREALGYSWGAECFRSLQILVSRRDLKSLSILNYRKKTLNREGRMELFKMNAHFVSDRIKVVRNDPKVFEEQKSPLDLLLIRIFFLNFMEMQFTIINVMLPVTLWVPWLMSPPCQAKIKLSRVRQSGILTKGNTLRVFYPKDLTSSLERFGSFSNSIR